MGDMTEVAGIDETKTGTVTDAEQVEKAVNAASIGQELKNQQEEREENVADGYELPRAVKAADGLRLGMNDEFPHVHIYKGLPLLRKPTDNGGTEEAAADAASAQAEADAAAQAAADAAAALGAAVLAAAGGDTSGTEAVVPSEK